jgi:hypothetical protein
MALDVPVLFFSRIHEDRANSFLPTVLHFSSEVFQILDHKTFPDVA